MRVSGTVYVGAQQTLRALTPLVGRGSSKLARGLRGRRAAHRRLAAWGRDRRDPLRPGLWLHAPSVGEGLQARAVLEALLRRSPDLQSVYTHFSPSAESLADRMPADARDYLPWDLPRPVREVLDAVRPDVVAFTKTEVWPVLVAEAAGRGARAVMVAGTVPPGAGRSRWPARTLLRPTWQRLSLVCASTAEDADGFTALGARPEAVRVTGDPGIDSAAARARGAPPGAPYLEPFHQDPRPTLVAGSTWPADDAELLPAVQTVRDAVPGLRVVLAPHEPDFRHVDGLRTMLEARRWTTATLGEVERSGRVEGIDAVVVDRVGVLAHLYTIGSVAYVGGGFHGAGLHSVLEPAAARLPVCFGPLHQNARAAADLVAGGGARVVAGRTELAEVVTDWILDTEARDYARACAFGYIERHLGAAERTAVLLAELLEPPRANGRT